MDRPVVQPVRAPVFVEHNMNADDGQHRSSVDREQEAYILRGEDLRSILFSMDNDSVRKDIVQGIHPFGEFRNDSEQGNPIFVRPGECRNEEGLAVKPGYCCGLE